MKGLFVKELAVLASSFKRNVLFITVFYGIISVLSRQPYMGHALVLVFALFSCSTVSFDENSHWDSYVRTMPVAPAQIMGCKYLFALGGVAVGAVFAAAISGLVNLIASVWVWDPDALQSPAEIAAAILVCGSIALLFVALVLPFSYKFNSVNARSWIFLLFGALAGLGGLIMAALPESTRRALINGLNTVNEATALWFFGVLFAVMLLLYGVSYLICVKIYEDKLY